MADSDTIRRLWRYKSDLEEGPDEEKLIQILKKLSSLKVSISSLQETGIGKVVNGFRSQGGVSGDWAKKVVALWKSTVQHEAQKQASLKDDEDEASDAESQTSSTSLEESHKFSGKHPHSGEKKIKQEKQDNGYSSHRKDNRDKNSRCKETSEKRDLKHRSHGVVVKKEKDVEGETGKSRSVTLKKREDCSPYNGHRDSSSDDLTDSDAETETPAGLNNIEEYYQSMLNQMDGKGGDAETESNTDTSKSLKSRTDSSSNHNDRKSSDTSRDRDCGRERKSCKVDRKKKNHAMSDSDNDDNSSHDRLKVNKVEQRDSKNHDQHRSHSHGTPSFSASLTSSTSSSHRKSSVSSSYKNSISSTSSSHDKSLSSSSHKSTASPSLTHKSSSHKSSSHTKSSSSSRHKTSSSSSSSSHHKTSLSSSSHHKSSSDHIQPTVSSSHKSSSRSEESSKTPKTLSERNSYSSSKKDETSTSSGSVHSHKRYSGSVPVSSSSSHKDLSASSKFSSSSDRLPNQYSSTPSELPKGSIEHQSKELPSYIPTPKKDLRDRYGAGDATHAVYVPTPIDSLHRNSCVNQDDCTSALTDQRLESNAHYRPSSKNNRFDERDVTYVPTRKIKTERHSPHSEDISCDMYVPTKKIKIEKNTSDTEGSTYIPSKKIKTENSTTHSDGVNTTSYIPTKKVKTETHSPLSGYWGVEGYVPSKKNREEKQNLISDDRNNGAAYKPSKKIKTERHSSSPHGLEETNTDTYVPSKYRKRTNSHSDHERDQYIPSKKTESEDTHFQADSSAGEEDRVSNDEDGGGSDEYYDRSGDEDATSEAENASHYKAQHEDDDSHSYSEHSDNENDSKTENGNSKIEDSDYESDSRREKYDKDDDDYNDNHQSDGNTSSEEINNRNQNSDLDDEQYSPTRSWRVKKEKVTNDHLYGGEKRSRSRSPSQQAKLKEEKVGSNRPYSREHGSGSKTRHDKSDSSSARNGEKHVSRSHRHHERDGSQRDGKSLSEKTHSSRKDKCRSSSTKSLHRDVQDHHSEKLDHKSDDGNKARPSQSKDSSRKTHNNLKHSSHSVVSKSSSSKEIDHQAVSVTSSKSEKSERSKSKAKAKRSKPELPKEDFDLFSDTVQIKREPIQSLNEQTVRKSHSSSRKVENSVDHLSKNHSSESKEQSSAKRDKVSSSKHKSSTYHEKSVSSSNHGHDRDAQTNSPSPINFEKPSSSSVKKRKKEELAHDDSGMSFDDFLNFDEAAVLKKSNHKTGSQKSSELVKKSRSSSSSSKRKGSLPTSSSTVPHPLPEVKLSDSDLMSLLPAPQTDYRPLKRNPLFQAYGVIDDPSEAKPDPAFDPDIVGTKANVRSKVYSGKKHVVKEMKSLHVLCLHVLMDNIDAMDHVGPIPFFILKPVLERCTPQQLYRLEDCNPHFIEDSEELWESHCKREFGGSAREEMESWRELYLRCMDEREAKYQKLKANMSVSMAKGQAGRPARLAYVDSVAKPPREVLRQQKRHGTGCIVKLKAPREGEERARGVHATPVRTYKPSSKVPAYNPMEDNNRSYRPTPPMLAKALQMRKNMMRR